MLLLLRAAARCWRAAAAHGRCSCCCMRRRCSRCCSSICKLGQGGVRGAGGARKGGCRGDIEERKVKVSGGVSPAGGGVPAAGRAGSSVPSSRAPVPPSLRAAALAPTPTPTPTPAPTAAPVTGQGVLQKDLRDEQHAKAAQAPCECVIQALPSQQQLDAQHQGRQHGQRPHLHARVQRGLMPPVRGHGEGHIQAYGAGRVKPPSSAHARQAGHWGGGAEGAGDPGHPGAPVHPPPSCARVAPMHPPVAPAAQAEAIMAGQGAGWAAGH